MGDLRDRLRCLIGSHDWYRHYLPGQPREPLNYMFSQCRHCRMVLVVPQSMWRQP